MFPYYVVGFIRTRKIYARKESNAPSFSYSPDTGCNFALL